MNSPAQQPLAISIGDPAGIGPEICVKACARFDAPCVLVGDASLIEQTAQQFDLPTPSIEPISHPACEAGKPNAVSGDAAFAAIKKATELVLANKARALVTAPIAKSALHEAGHLWPGHTELLAELAGGCEVRMMLANPELRVVLVTVHQPLRQALDRLSADLIEQTLVIANSSLQNFGVTRPRLAVAGVNPHAGEDGLFGDEESRIVTPAIERARDAGINASGPFPPDTIFMRARGLQEFDAVIAMYHDQGLIPVKYLGVEQGVNVTLGLPFVRTSPDHGTAFDIAGQRIADPASMLAAMTMADQLSRRPATEHDQM